MWLRYSNTSLSFDPPQTANVFWHDMARQSDTKWGTNRKQFHWGLFGVIPFEFLLHCLHRWKLESILTTVWWKLHDRWSFLLTLHHTTGQIGPCLLLRFILSVYVTFVIYIFHIGYNLRLHNWMSEQSSVQSLCRFEIGRVYSTTPGSSRQITGHFEFWWRRSSLTGAKQKN